MSSDTSDLSQAGWELFPLLGFHTVESHLTSLPPHVNNGLRHEKSEWSTDMPLLPNFEWDVPSWRSLQKWDELKKKKIFLSAVMHAHRFYIEPWTGSHTRKFKRKKSGNFVMLWTFADLKISFWQKCDLKFIFPVSSEFTITMDRNFLVLCVMLVFTSLIGGSNPQSTSGSTTGRLCVWEREKREREREMHMKLFFKNWFL